MFEEFAELSIKLKCRFGCGLQFNNKPAESQHALYYCKSNPMKRKRKKRVYASGSCKYCQNVFVRVKRHEIYRCAQNPALSQNK